MGKKICEVIPVSNFRERVRITKELENKGITPQNLDNCLLINYSIKKEKIRCY